jgi:hypothetical protein
MIIGISRARTKGRMMTIGILAITSRRSRRKGRNWRMIAMRYRTCWIKISINSKLWNVLPATASPTTLDSTKLYSRLRTITPNSSPNSSKNKMKFAELKRSSRISPVMSTS